MTRGGRDEGDHRLLGEPGLRGTSYRTEMRWHCSGEDGGGGHAGSEEEGEAAPQTSWGSPRERERERRAR